MNIPTLIMVNKIDLLGADPEGVYRQMRALLSEHAFTVQSVLEAGTRSPQVLPLESMDTETMAILSRKAEVFPVLFGSGLHGVGIEELLNAVVSYLPPPRGRPGNSLSAIVYKIEYRPRQGRLLHVRVYEGTLRCREELVHIETSVKDKPTRLLTLADGREFRETDRLEAGDLGIIYGLKDWKIGDIIGDPRGVPELQSSRQPLLTVQVYPKQQSELIRLVRALQQLEDEDPLLNVTWMEDIRELHVRFFGNVQLEIISSLLRSRFGLEAQFSEPSVIYKETPAAVGTGSVAYVTHGYALMTLKVEPGEPDSGVTFVSEISGDMIYPKYQKQIRQVLPAVLRRGPRGYEVIDVKVTLIDGDSQKPITQPSDFRIATPLAMEDALRRTGTVLLEPIVEFELIVPDSYSPVVLSELYKYHMAQGTPVSRHGYTTIEGTMTLADSMNFSILLQSKTAGEAMLQTRFIGYQRARLQ
jgi:ribosomal protection tetracycline resistance protein